MKIELKAINLSTRTWCYYMIEKDEELQLMLIIHIISKINNSVILSYCLPYMIECFIYYLFLFIYLIGSANILKLLIK